MDKSIIPEAVINSMFPKFVGTDKYAKVFYFSTGVVGSYVDVKDQHYWVKPADVYKVIRPVATLVLKYGDLRQYTILLDAEHATMIVDWSKAGKVRSHFFMYRGFINGTPFTWELQSRYKKYQGLRGTIET